MWGDGGSGVSTEEDEDRGCDDGEAGTGVVEGVEGKGRCKDEGEEEGGAEPVDDGGSCGEECGCGVGDGRVGEPLRMMAVRVDSSRCGNEFELLHPSLQ